MNNYKIATNEAIALIINLLCSKFFLNTPRYLTDTAGNAAWLLIIYYLAITFISWLIYIKMYKTHTPVDLLDISQSIGGNPLKVIVGSLCCIMILLITSIAFRQYIESVKILSLHESPLGYIGLLFGVGMIVGAYLGIKSVAKVHGFFVPIIYIIVIILTIMSYSNYDFTALTPVMGKGTNAIFGSGFFMLSTMFELIILFFLPPMIKKHENFDRIGLISLFFSLLYIIMITLGFILTIPNLNSAEQNLPIFQVIRLIQLGTFFQRMDSVFLIVFTISALMYLSGMLFFLTYIFRKTFELEYEKPLYIPLGLLVLSFSIINVYSKQVMLFIEKINMYIWILPIILPVVLLLLYNKFKFKTN